MKKVILVLAAILAVSQLLSAQVFNDIPMDWKWVGQHSAALTYDGSYTGKKDYLLDAKYRKIVKTGISYPRKYTDFPLRPEGAVNLTFSPDSTKLAFTRANNLWVADIATGAETQLTFDGSETILNGYASWVYYEEIFGRASRYRAFWWSPDSKVLAFYRFDNERVPVFPIYSPFAEDYDRSGMRLSYSQNAGAAVALPDLSPDGGSVRMTRYPLCGDPNPEVRIGFAHLDDGKVVWADFDEHEDQYFGHVFWNGRKFFVQREPRLQNTLDLYAVSPDDGSKEHIYHEHYKTWLDWIEGIKFGSEGFYTVRSFETLWQQIYYISYDGKTVRRLTDGENWRMSIIDVDEASGRLIFTAERSSRTAQGLYLLDTRKGQISAISPDGYDVDGVRVSPDHHYVIYSQSSYSDPYEIWLCDVLKPQKSCKLEDFASPSFHAGDYSLPKAVEIQARDGLKLYGYMVLPRDFDPSRKYPVHVDLYGGPDTPQVRNRWYGVSRYDFYSENGIIELVADCRASGHNGREGMDQIYRQLDVLEIRDFVDWGLWLQSLPYVRADKIGVEGFSFGGTMAALLVMDHSDVFHYGIAGGGVYDWALYDTHYTERFMDTPQANAGGYALTRVIDHAKNYPVEYSDSSDAAAVEPVMLKLTHGTGDDNVHFQNTLRLADALQKNGKIFELMIYPDGMHGYRGYQGAHFNSANQAFWLRYLLSAR